MEEAFLHYIWKFQYFDKSDLRTSDGLPISIFRPGTINTDKGPDFENSRISIGEVEWNGSVEIHVKGKDWYNHSHHKDPSYDGVILHVVWDGQEKETLRSDDSKVPILELGKRIDSLIFEKYKKLTGNPDRIHCHSFLKEMDRLKIFEVFDKVVVERLNRKATEMLIRLRKNNFDWEETCFQLLSANFGFKVNKESFISLAENIPFKILQKHSNNIIQVEAILFGVAGFLDQDLEDDYHSLLKKEYSFLQKKYSFNSFLKRHQWKFLRLRPANFPTIRIAQLAMLIHVHQKFFSSLIELTEIVELKKIIKVEQSSYWRQHYDFGKKAERKIGVLGESSINNILINTVAPLMAAYSIEKDELSYLEYALVILQKLPPESNNIITEWKNSGTKITNAFDSQAAIELLNNYCNPKKCLDCSIGINILQSN